MGELSVLLLACLGVGMYLLYDRGYLAAQSKRALLFVGSMGFGGNVCHARFAGCTGQRLRNLRFREGKPVAFTLSASLTKGNMSVLVLDRAGAVLLALDPACPQGTLRPEEKVRYQLMIRFDRADGEYRLEWN